MSKIHPNNGLTLEDFANLSFVTDDDEYIHKKKKKKKKSKKKNKNKSCKTYKSKKKNISVFDKILGAVDVSLDSTIKVSISDETINRAIDTGVNIVKYFRDRKQNSTNSQTPQITSKSEIDK